MDTIVPASLSAQLVTLVVTIYAIGVKIIWMKRNRDIWFQGIPTTGWLIHIAVFYFAVVITDLFQIPRPFSFMGWSVILRLHIVLSISIFDTWKLLKAGKNGK
jgi:hypothetical protein